MRGITMHTLLKSAVAVVAAALIAAPAYGHSPAAGRSAPVSAAGAGWKEMQLRYPGSDAVVLYDSLVVTYGADGRISKRRHREVMLFTDNAINRYGDPRILFDAATQDLTILAARVRMRDGTIVDVRKNAVNQTTPFALDLAPDYADWQETVVTHMGIEKGCVAELHYMIADKNPSPYLSGVEVFSAEDPTEERVLAVKLPPGMTLKFAPLREGAPAPDTRTSGTWAWAVRDIPGRTPFDGGVWEGEYFPSICYSTAASWREALAPIAGDIAIRAKSVPRALAGVIREKIKDCATDEDEALAVQRFAIESVRAVSAPFSLLAFSGRDAASIYESGYAGALDRAILLMAMLKEAGFAPTAVLVSAGRVRIDSVPAPELCSSVAVAVPVKGAGELLLDPSTPLEHDPAFSLAGRTIVYLGSEPRLVPLPPKEISASMSELSFALSPGAEGIWEGKGKAILTGAFSPYYLVREKESGLEDFLKGRVAGFFRGAELVSWNPRTIERDKAEIEFTFTVKLPEKKKGERVYLAMPNPFESKLSGIERVRPERSRLADAIRIEPSALSLIGTIEPPAGWKLVTEHFSAHQRVDFGEASAEFSTRPDGMQYFTRRLLFANDRVYPAGFDRFRSLLGVFARDLIVLEKE
jgi:hypothetical protein